MFSESYETCVYVRRPNTVFVLHFFIPYSWKVLHNIKTSSMQVMIVMLF